jgi:Tfp pilus assembly protein PilF
MKRLHTFVLLCLLGMAPIACSKTSTEDSAAAPPNANAAPPGPAAELIGRGVKELDAGQIAEAIATFEQAVEKDPGSVEAHLKLAGAHMASQDFRAGIEQFKKAIGLDPSNPRGFIGLGIAYMHGGDTALSQAAFEEALRLDPSREEQLRPILDRLKARNAGSTMPHPQP